MFNSIQVSGEWMDDEMIQASIALEIEERRSYQWKFGFDWTLYSPCAIVIVIVIARISGHFTQFKDLKPVANLKRKNVFSQHKL